MWEKFYGFLLVFFNALSHIIVFTSLGNDNEGKKKDIILLFCSIENILIWNCTIMPIVAEHNHHVPEDSTRLMDGTNSVLSEKLIIFRKIPGFLKKCIDVLCSVSSGEKE